MKRSFFDISNSVFYEIAQSTVEEINFRSSEKIDFSIIEKTPKCRVTVPKPRKIDGNYFFEGCVFENYDKDYETIWSLYLATVSHMAAHAKISDYTKYEKWMKNKTVEKCQKVIDFVEDVRVEEYLKKSFPETWQHITSIKNMFEDLHGKTSKCSNEKFYKSYYTKKSKKIVKLRKKLSQCDEFDVDDIVSYLDFLYKNQTLLPKYSLPYCMHRDDDFSQNDFLKNVKIYPEGQFARIVSDLDDVWVKEKRGDKNLIECQNFAEDSRFDEVVVSSENLGEYTRLANESDRVLKKVRSTVKTLANIIDNPSSEKDGLLNLQLAIQREASKNTEIQIFEQDTPRKEPENWLVIVDASASMISKFDEMKKMALCLSEAAEYVNQGRGKWGLYGFNNNFLVVKDQVDEYDLQSKARIGGIENKGSSLIPDAVDMGIKILKRDIDSMQKYLILISDGKPSGYDDIDECFKKSLLNARQNGIQVIGIGVPKRLSKYFSFIINDDDPGKIIEKFFSMYSNLVQTIK